MLFVTDPTIVAGSIWATAAVSIVPLIAFFFFLMGLKWHVHWSAIAATAIAAVSATTVFRMPPLLVGASFSQGFTYGFFPIVLCIWMAIWIHDVTVVSGRFADLRTLIGEIGHGDIRIQAILIGFCFNALIESFAGFGAPIAITAAMMIALGIKPMRAVTVSLVSNVSVAAFGPMSIPITIAGSMTSLDPARIGGLVALQIGVLAIGFPLLQCAILDGWRGVKELWWYALAIGIAWSLAANLTVRFVSYELTCLLASLVSLAVAVLLLRPWRTPAVLSRVDATLALLPYIFVVAVFAVANIVVNKPLNALTVTFNWPLVATRILHSQPVFSLNWATTPGTLLFVAGLLTVAVYRRWPKHTDSTTASLTWQSAFAQLGSGAARLWVTALTICTVMGLAYVMNYSGQTGAIGTVLSLTGPFAIILSPVLGFIGTAVTGSTGSSNALFASMQVAAASAVEADPLLFVAASTSGAVVGKIISPELLAVTAAVINHRGAEQEILKTVTPYAVGILVVVCLYVFAQQVLFY